MQRAYRFPRWSRESPESQRLRLKLGEFRHRFQERTLLPLSMLNLEEMLNFTRTAPRGRFHDAVSPAYQASRLVPISSPGGEFSIVTIFALGLLT